MPKHPSAAYRRDLWRMKGQVFAITLVVVSGVATFIGREGRVIKSFLEYFTKKISGCHQVVEFVLDYLFICGYD